MHAHLVTGGSAEDRGNRILEILKSWQAGRFDLVEIGDGITAIGISDIREFVRRISLMPQSGNVTAGIIRGGHTLTQEAQQALLKTLEEPPAHARVIIETGQTGLLLPTVISRIVIDRLTAEEKAADDTDVIHAKRFMKLLYMSPGRRLSALEQFGKSRETAAEFVRESLVSFHRLAARTDETADPPLPHGMPVMICRALLDATRELSGNVTPALVLETIFFRCADPQKQAPGTLDMP